MKQVFRFDSNGFYVEPVILNDNDPIPVDCTEIQPPHGLFKGQFLNGAWVEGKDPADILNDAKAAKLAELSSSYSKALTDGFVTNATGTPINFKYAEIDQLNFTKRTNAVALGTSDASFPFGTADGVITFTTEQWKVIAKDAENHEMTTYDKLVSLRSDVDTAATPDAVNAIVWE